MDAQAWSPGTERREDAADAGAAARAPVALLAGDGRMALRPPAGDAGVRLLIAGDLSLPSSARIPGEGETHPWEGLIPEIEAHDLAIVNLEAALRAVGTEGAPQLTTTSVVKHGPVVTSPLGLAGLTRRGGFTAVSLANNHILDAGPDGLRSTLALAWAAGLQTVGAGEDRAEAERALVVEAGGMKVAVIAAAEREFSIATGDAPGAAPLDPWVMWRRVAEARDQADCVVVILHAGNEYAGLPRPGLAHAARSLAEAGAAAIVCHHAHVPTGLEVWRGVPIAYGTGNFLFPAPEPQPPGWYLGYMVSLRLDTGGVSEVRLIPTQQESGGGGEVGGNGASPGAQAGSDTGFRVAELTGRRRGEMLAKLDILSATIADDAALAEQWTSLTRRQGSFALATLLGLTRGERLLARAGVWPGWRRRRAAVPGLLDLLTCDSHRELTESLLAERLAPPRQRRGPR